MRLWEDSLSSKIQSTCVFFLFLWFQIRSWWKRKKQQRRTKMKNCLNRGRGHTSSRAKGSKGEQSLVFCERLFSSKASRTSLQHAQLWTVACEPKQKLCLKKVKTCSLSETKFESTDQGQCVELFKTERPVCLMLSEELRWYPSPLWFVWRTFF